MKLIWHTNLITFKIQMCLGFPYLFWDFSQCTSSPWITLFNSSWLRIHCKSAWQLRKRFVRLVCRSRKVRWQTEKERNLVGGLPGVSHTRWKSRGDQGVVPSAFSSLLVCLHLVHRSPSIYYCPCIWLILTDL